MRWGTAKLFTQAELNVARSNPRQDEKTTEDDHDEVLDGLEENRGRKDLTDETSDPAFRNGGTEVEGSRSRKLEAGKAI